MPYYVVGLEFGGEEPHIVERNTSSKETIRDLIVDIGVSYNVDVVHFALNNDGQDYNEKNAPLDKSFLDKTVEEVLDQEEDSAEENTIMLTVKNYDEEKMRVITELKGQVKQAAAALEAAKAALKAAAAPKISGGKRNTRRRH